MCEHFGRLSAEGFSTPFLSSHSPSDTAIRNKFTRQRIHPSPPAWPSSLFVELKHSFPEVIGQAVEGPIPRAVSEVPRYVVRHLLDAMLPTWEWHHRREDIFEPLPQFPFKRGAVKPLEHLIVDGF